MSNNPSNEKLMELFRGVAVTSSIELFDGDNKDQAVQRLGEILSAATEHYAANFPPEVSGAPPLNLSSLEQLRGQNLQRLKAFLQALDSTSNPSMLVMVWRILHGDLIKSVEMKYEQKREFRLDVALEDLESGHTSKYQSLDIDDAALVRHFGIMKMSDLPLFDGFYALRT